MKKPYWTPGEGNLRILPPKKIEPFFYPNKKPECPICNSEFGKNSTRIMVPVKFEGQTKDQQAFVNLKPEKWALLEKLIKHLDQIKRLLGEPVVTDAPKWINTFDKIIVVYPHNDTAKKRIVKVIAFDTKTGEPKGSW